MIQIKNDVKEFERNLFIARSAHAIFSIKRNRIVAINVVLKIDVSDDIFSYDIKTYNFYFNKFPRILYKLLSINNTETEYVIL